MKKTIALLAFAGLSLFTSCGENKDTDIVPSGTYQGKAEEVDADEKEIYVRTPDDKLLELYFTDATTLTKDGETVEFSTLHEGGEVEVTVEKKGNKLDPVSVKVLD
ncbi:hypothetical protein [Flavobacterium rhizosphaerae]|uniref:Uncharacterized protein n=1 Tax=Flavobacterium rhizosphaerae TaxID=3163298 RepID=A0ABW8YTI8_9FLAO